MDCLSFCAWILLIPLRDLFRRRSLIARHSASGSGFLCTAFPSLDFMGSTWQAAVLGPHGQSQHLHSGVVGPQSVTSDPEN